MIKSDNLNLIYEIRSILGDKIKEDKQLEQAYRRIKYEVIQADKKILMGMYDSLDINFGDKTH